MDYYYYLAIPSLFLLLLINRLIIKKFRNDLPPSLPFHYYLPIIGHLHLLKKPIHRTLAKLSDKYGPIILLYFGSRPVIVVSSPSLVGECLTKNDLTFANRFRFMAGKYFGYGYTTLTWSSYGQHWRNLRKVFTMEILSAHRVQSFEDIRRQEIHALIRRLVRFSSESPDGYGVVEMKTAFFELVLNIVMRMLAGKRYHGEDDQKNREEATRFQQIIEEGLQLVGAMSIEDFVPLIKWFGGKSKLEVKLKGLHEKRDRFMQDLIEERRENRGSVSSCDQNNKNETIIDVLLSLQDTDPEYYTDEIIKGIQLVMLIAGTDTSSGTMEWALAALLNNPVCLKKAQQEIDIKIGQHSRLINDSDLGHEHLPYLHSVINETLRMYPVAPLLVPHVSSQDCIVGGHRIPRGTMLIVNMWAIQNDPKIWGGAEDSAKFKPERFLALEGQRDGFMFVPFGYGRRGCPGENMAMKVVGLTLGLLLQCFDWERVDEELVDMTEGPGLTMPRAKPLLVKCKPRPQMVQLLLDQF